MSPSVWRRILLPLSVPGSFVYGGALAARNWLYDERYLPVRSLSAPVLSVGNLGIGGSGKTPIVAALARRLIARGQPVAVLSRGYGRRNQRDFLLVSDGERLLADAAASGDEPVELAESVEGLVVAVGTDRHRAGTEVLRRLGRHLFILDDGFQHRQLRRDLDLVCMDAGEPLSALRLLPAGRLREPLSRLRRADGLVWTRSGRERPAEALASAVARAAGSPPVTIRFANTIAAYRRCDAAEESLTPDALRGQSIGVLAAIARPERLLEELEESGMRVASVSLRRDHHRWRPAEVRAALEIARRRGARAVLTTGKDAVKLGPLVNAPLPVYRIDLRAEPLEGEILDAMLARLAG